VLQGMAEGKNNAAIAESLVITERSVEKVIHSIFLNLGLAWETAVHKRVKAVVFYLAEADHCSKSAPSSVTSKSALLPSRRIRTAASCPPSAAFCNSSRQQK
jgi:hypothetical protein